MDKEELMKKTKEELVKMLIEFMQVNDRLLQDNDRLLQDNKTLKTENERAKIDTYIYSEFLATKEMYERECQANVQNNRVINELSELLDRYKNIVDKLGGKYNYD